MHGVAGSFRSLQSSLQTCARTKARRRPLLALFFSLFLFFLFLCFSASLPLCLSASLPLLLPLPVSLAPTVALCCGRWQLRSSSPANQCPFRRNAIKRRCEQPIAVKSSAQGHFFELCKVTPSCTVISRLSELRAQLLVDLKFAAACPIR